MQKRVGLARAIAASPEILFFDEPTTGLDPIMGAVIDGLIVDCVKRLGATAITITHDMHSARRIGERRQGSGAFATRRMGCKEGNFIEVRLPDALYQRRGFLFCHQILPDHRCRLRAQRAVIEITQPQSISLTLLIAVEMRKSAINRQLQTIEIGI